MQRLNLATINAIKVESKTYWGLVFFTATALLLTACASPEEKMQQEYLELSKSVSEYEGKGYVQLGEMLAEFCKELGGVIENDQKAQVADAVDLIKRLENNVVKLAVFRCARAEEPGNEWIDFVYERDLPIERKVEYGGKGLMIERFSKYLRQKARLEELVEVCPNCKLSEQ